MWFTEKSKFENLNKAVLSVVNPSANPPETDTPEDVQPEVTPEEQRIPDENSEVLQETVDEGLELQVKMALSDINVEGKWKKGKLHVPAKHVDKVDKHLRSQGVKDTFHIMGEEENKSNFADAIAKFKKRGGKVEKLPQSPNYGNYGHGMTRKDKEDAQKIIKYRDEKGYALKK
jgi:hypothetical protein